jgi:hypothetical protein
MTRQELLRKVDAASEALVSMAKLAGTYLFITGLGGILIFLWYLSLTSEPMGLFTVIPVTIGLIYTLLLVAKDKLSKWVKQDPEAKIIDWKPSKKTQCVPTSGQLSISNKEQGNLSLGDRQTQPQKEFL